MNPKVAHVLAAGQSRKHHCHWPGCAAQVPPARWGCRGHWFALPPEIRTAIWRAYAPGQEETGTPGPAYITAARAAQDWIAATHPPAPESQGDLFGPAAGKPRHRSVRTA